MSDRTPNRDSARRQSGVLDAIFDVVEDKPDLSQGSAANVFRAKALAEIDVPKQVDNLLPLTSRRYWLALVGMGLVIVAGLVYAGAIVQTTSVTVTGRAVAASGMAVAASPVGQVIAAVLVQDGSTVRAGQPLAEGVAVDASVTQVVSPIDGTVWQVLGSVGGILAPGQTAATILPVGSGDTILVAVPESQSAEVTTGLTVNVSGTSASSTGTVTAMSSGPIPSELAGQRLGIQLPPGDQMTMVTVSLAEPIPAGMSLTAQIVISQQTLLQQLTGSS
jgi:multidrug efflux pump subunit AcrA (membrane-fusion protein)